MQKYLANVALTLAVIANSSQAADHIIFKFESQWAKVRHANRRTFVDRACYRGANNQNVFEMHQEMISIAQELRDRTRDPIEERGIQQCKARASLKEQLKKNPNDYGAQRQLLANDKAIKQIADEMGLITITQAQANYGE